MHDFISIATTQRDGHHLQTEKREIVELSTSIGSLSLSSAGRVLSRPP
jgi:hypothetical protein